MELLRNLFQILEQDSDTFTIKLASKEHPVFKAHFPGNELLPGFIQIDIIANILGHTIKKILKAKFISLIKPNDIIEYSITESTKNNFKIIIRQKDYKKISEIVYETK